MTSRTPIRLTPHRGPLATPSTSSENSPTSFSPSTDISQCSVGIGQALHVALLQHKISTLSLPLQHQSQPCLYHRRHERLFGCDTHLYPLGFISEDLCHSVWDLARTLGRIVTFCLLIWGLLEWSSYASELHRQPNTLSVLRIPLPSSARALRCYVSSPLSEPRDQHVAVLQFLSEQIQHARALSSLSIGFGLPLRAFFEAHRAIIPRAIVQHHFATPSHLVQDVDTLTNLTEFLDSSLLDFGSSSFIGRSLTLALDELGTHISEPTIRHGSSTHKGHQDAHLRAIYWRTTSNLLLEYSAACPRARRLLQQLHALHQQLLPLTLAHYTARNVEERLNIRWWKSSLYYHATSNEERMQAFVTGLEITLDNVRRLVAYLDWITERLAQTTLGDVLEIRHKPDFSSCVMSLRELFAQSRPSTPQKHCVCLGGYRATPIRPERVEITVPGSATVRAGR